MERTLPTSSPGVGIGKRDESSAWPDLESGFPSDASFKAAALDEIAWPVWGENRVGVLLTWNAAASARYGHAPWEVVGRHSSKLVPRDLIDEADAIRERVLAGETVGPFETERLHRDGHRMAVTLVVSPVRDASGVPTGTLTVTRHDASPVSGWLESLAERSEDVFYKLSLAPSGLRVEYVNPAMERLTGHSAAAFYEDPGLARRILHPEDRPHILARLRAGDTEALEQLEMRWVHRDGRVIWVDLINVFAHDANGRPVGVAGVVRDITTEKRDERGLRSANERLELALRATRQGMFEVDLPTQTVVHSTNLEDVFGAGFPQKNFPVDRWFALVLTGDINRLRILWQDVSSGRRDSFEEEYRIGTRGSTTWFVTSGRVVSRDASGRPLRFLGIHTDVTQLREAQQARHDVEERHWSLFENLAQGVIYYDSLGRPTEINPAAERILGMTMTELRERSVSDPRWRMQDEHGAPMSPDEFPAVRALRTGRAVDGVIMRFQRDDRDVRILKHARPLFGSADDTPTGVLVTFTDVTALWEARTALGRTEQRYRLIVENTPDIIARHDTDGRYIYITPNCERFFGVGPDELVGRLPVEVGLPAEAAAAMEAAIANVYATAESTEKEFALSDHQGEMHHFQWRVFPEHDGDGVSSVVSVMQDVTARRQLEEQFLQSQKMEAVGRLAGGVAHDFNNLLTGIQAYVSFLLSALPQEDPRRPDAEQIEHAANRAASLTRQLLAFSRRQVMQPRIVDLTEVVNDVQGMLRRIVGEDIAISTHTAEPHGAVRADPGQVEQVILNLVVNARDAMPEGGRIDITVRDADVVEQEVGPRSTAEYRPPPGAYVTLAVADNGPGVPQHLRTRIFEPFFTTKEQGRGTGLGLSTVYGIVKQSGGHILLDSEVGRGSTFTIYLPRTTEATITALPAQRSESKRGDETILLVEDDEMVRTLAVRALRSVGFRVIEAKNGEEALERVREHGSAIDLVLTDVIMPGMNGRELIETIARTNPNVPYLLMSGYTDDVISQHGIAPEDARFLEKPFTPSTLTRRVRQILDRREPDG